MVDIDSTHLLSDSGFTLSIEEKAALQISMLERKNAEGFDKLYFWGKIMGKDNDYLICYGLLPSYDFPTKKFYFWCVTQLRRSLTTGALTPSFAAAPQRSSGSSRCRCPMPSRRTRLQLSRVCSRATPHSSQVGKRRRTL